MEKSIWKDPWIILAIILFIIGFIGTYGYFILKAVGIIHSPAWIGYIPIFASSLVISSMLIGVGKVLEKVSRIDKIETRLDKVIEDVVEIKIKLSSNEGAIEKHDATIGKLTSNVEKLNSAVFSG